jgi:capsular exopolysaccharide synthesis family protein
MYDRKRQGLKMLFKKNKSKDQELAKIVVGKGASRRTVEGYNRLKDNVLYMSADGKNKVIQIESARASEGKTTICCNLAVSLGLTKKKVVVVDLDFYRPTAHVVFGQERANGVSDYILGSITKKELIKHTEYENVDLITGGENVYNSSLILVSDTFKELINSLKEEYDYVLLDCAPVLAVSDYIHISEVSDGVLFVVAYASTTKNSVADAVKELKRNGVNILGSVFSKYERKKDGGYYDYYYKSQTM